MKSPAAPTRVVPRRHRLVRFALPLLVAATAGAAGGWVYWSGGEPERLWTEARLAYQDERADLAEVALARLARLGPLTSEQWLIRARAAQILGKLDDALADLAHVPDADSLDGLGLRLLPALADVSALPRGGKSLIVVADLQKVLHFRIFEAAGTAVVDTDENRLPGKSAQIAELKRLLKGLWHEPRLSEGDKVRVNTAVASVVGYTPLAPMARLREGQIERSRDRVRVAERHFLHALELNPRLIQAHRELIYIYGMQLRRPALHARFRALSAISALTFDDLFLWGLSRGLTWEAAEAAGTLRKYVEADPGDRNSRLALIDNLQRLDQQNEVARLLAALPEQDPSALAIRARQALNGGDAAGASTLLAKGPPDHPEMARLRGQIAMARRDWQAAAGHFRAALATEPESRDALRGLGQALSALGDRDGAAAPLEAARRLDRVTGLIARAGIAGNRENQALIRDLGDACRDAGLVAEARGWFRLAVTRDPLDAQAQRKLYLLDSQTQAQPEPEPDPAIVPVPPAVTPG